MLRRPCPVSAVLDDIRSAWNVGSMFRTADAAGLTGLYLCGITPTPPRADLEKTALGAQRVVPWDYWPSSADLLRHLRAQGHRLVALECTEDAVSMDQAATAFPLVFVVGNEVSGIGHELRSLCHATAMIPMNGLKESLNVAVSFGLMAYASRRCWELSMAPSRRRE